MSDLSKHIAYDAETVQSIIGEGLHTGLRKGTDAPEADALWEAISGSEEAWSDALAYLVRGLEQMGVVVSKEPTPVTVVDSGLLCEVCRLGYPKNDDRGEPLGPVRYFEYPHHAHLSCGRSKGWEPR